MIDNVAIFAGKPLDAEGTVVAHAEIDGRGGPPGSSIQAHGAVRRIAAYFRAELAAYAVRKGMGVDEVPGALKFFGSDDAPPGNHVTAAEIRAFMEFAGAGDPTGYETWE